MLRVTLRTANRSTVFVIEGRLTGPWAKELVRIVRRPDRAIGCIVDLREISFVDFAGEYALRTLSNSGVRFIADSTYGRNLCRRLKLCRLTTPAGGGQPPQKTEGSPFIF